MLVIGAWLASSLSLLLGKKATRLDKKRQQQLQQFDEEQGDIIAILTYPIVKFILPIWPFKPKMDLEKMLWLSGWNKHFNATSFKALNIFSGIIVSLFGILVMSSSPDFLGVAWGAVLIVFGWHGPTFLLKNEVKSKNEKILRNFPETSNIIYAYLFAGLTLIESLEESISFVSPEWQKILKEFVAIARLKSTEEAVDWLRGVTDVSAVREYSQLLRLIIEQGNAKGAMEKQADRIQNIQKQAMLSKITTREAYATALQFPLLLTALLTIMAPTVHQMMGVSF